MDEYQSQEPVVEEGTLTKKRHGCLTAWLIFLLVANSGAGLIYLIKKDDLANAFPHAPGWTFTAMLLLAIFNLICAVSLFNWKKWGFWGIGLSSIAALIVNLIIGVNGFPVVGGLVGLLILYGVLQIGGEKSGWSQLE